MTDIGFNEITNDVIKLQEEIKVLAKQMTSLKTVLKSLRSKKIAKEGSGKEAQQLQQNTKKINTAIAKTNELQLKSIQTKKQLADTIQKNITQRTKAGKLLLEQKTSLQQTNKLLKREAEINFARTKSGQKATKMMREQQTVLRKLRGTTGSFTKSIIKATLRLGAMHLGFRSLIRIVGGALKTAIEFQAANSKLASILGTTRKNISLLATQAKELGKNYKFTASETVALQTELAKLGFTQTEILNLTEAVIQGSIAMSTGLAEAATLTGSTLRAFGLDAKESQRVIDVLSDATTKSALDFEKLNTALAIVSPVAKNANQTIESTVATLGALVDRGVDASTAATGLRNVYLELAKQGLTLEDALSKIQQSSDKNATSLQLFGKRGATIGTILAETTIEVDEFTKALNNAGGAAQRIVSEQMTTLDFWLKSVKSSWENLTIAIEDGDKGTGKLIKRLLVLSTFALDKLAESSKSATQEIRELAGEDALEKLENILLSTTETGKEFDKFIISQITASNDLIKQYEKEFGALDSRNDSTLVYNQTLLETQKILVTLLKEQKRSDEEMEFYDDTIINDVVPSLKILALKLNEVRGIFKNIQGDDDNQAIDSMVDDIIGDDDPILEMIAKEKEAREQKERDEIDTEQRIADAKKDIAQASFDFAATLLDNQIQGIEEKNKMGVLSDEKAAKEIAKIRRKQALLGKANALFEIAINTASAVSKVSAQTGVGAFLAAPLITALGALQIATVLAQKIPKFAKGVIGFKGEGTKTSDSNHVMISNKESVITGDGTEKAPRFLEGLNSNDSNVNLIKALMSDGILEPFSPAMLKLNPTIEKADMNQKLYVETLAGNKKLERLIKLQEDKPEIIPVNKDGYTLVKWADGRTERYIKA